MANSDADEASDHNTQIIREFRANGGRVGGMWAGVTLILIHHVGARSAIERVTPVACSPQPGGRFAIWAANGGSPTHPTWYHNLKAHPTITAEVGTQTFTVLAQELGGTARAQLWPKLVVEWPKPAAWSLTSAQPGHDQAAVSGVPADPPGLTRDENPACAWPPRQRA
jgi:deazaflavin-dependent oxidoreductase (nitroreductase family)